MIVIEDQARSIFLAALERTPDQWPAFLDEACAGNPELRARVNQLLDAHQAMGSIHGGAADLPSPLRGEPQVPGQGEGAVATVDGPVTEQPGTVIGPYKLLQQIGEGGMGVVFMAEQTEPVQRKVALKIIKPGIDSRQVIARLEAERQALALMDHPNIAKVLDAGTTESGRPYFVMELVKGAPITLYCDQHRLTPQQRLELFVPVCQAVQHAHHKGIIHRDLKPSNVLVAEYDDKPVAKVIDFGVAKATGPKLTEHTMFTEFGQIVGTLEYMSPEQAKLNALDIDTRSDIYALGVLLYELLTGTTPFEKKRLGEAAFDEMLRIIREEEPPKPSSRLSTTEELPSIAANRGLEPKKLSGLVRGDLDWIVMKCLEKDRNRRYETANGLAHDIERHLHDEPVQASPPSAWYRFRKFARRNKAGLAVACLILLFIAVLGGGGGWVIRDRTVREQQLTAQVELILDDVERLERDQKWPEALATAERAEAALAGGQAGEAIRQRVGDVRRDLAFVAELDRIRQDSALVVERKPSYREAARAYGRAFREYGVDVETLPADEAVARLQARPALAMPVAAALDDWVVARRKLGEHTRSWNALVAIARRIDSDPLRDRLRAMWAQQVAPELQAELRQLAEWVDVKSQSPATLLILAWTLLDMQLADSAMQVLRDGHYTYPGDFWLAMDLGLQLFDRKDYAQAVRYFEIAVAIRPGSVGAHTNLGAALDRSKDLKGAIRECRVALQIDPDNVIVHFNLGTVLYYTNDLEGAIREFHAALQTDPNYAIAHCNLGIALRDAKDLEGAIREFHAALKIDPNIAEAHNNLGLALHDKKDLEGAIREFHAALKIEPNDAITHYNLGLALRDKKDLEEAIREFHAAVKIDPNNADAHNNLGNALYEKNDLEGAIRELRAALQIDPNNAIAHYNLGAVLNATNDPDGAIREYRKVLALKPDIAQAHCNLGQTLRQKGEFREALTELRRGHELGSKNPGWPYPSAKWVRECERQVELDGQLPGFLKGKTTPASPEERIELAGLCALKRLNRAAVLFYEQAFAADPNLAEDLQASHRYNAACAAALAGCGQGKDADTLDDTKRARLRRQALDWLRADVAAWGRLLDKEPGKATKAADVVQHWLQDTDFTGVRGPEALAKLPEAERQPWQKLWNDVGDLLKRARGKTGPEKK